MDSDPVNYELYDGFESDMSSEEHEQNELQGVEEALFEEEAPRQHDRPPHMPLEDRIIVFTQLFSQLVGPSKALGLDQEGIYRLLHHPVVETLPASVVAAALQVVRGKKYSTVDYAAAIQEVWGAYIDPNEPANDAAVNVMHKILRPANFEDIKLAHSFPLPDELFQAAAKSGIDITALPDLHADVHQMQAPSIMDALDSVKGWSEVANLMGRQSAQGGLVSMAQVEEASKAAVQTLQKFSADIRAHKRDVLEALSLLHEQAKLAENAISASRTRLISCSNHTRSLVLELMGVLKLSSSDDASSTARKPQQKQQQQQHQQVSLFASNGGVDVKQQHQGSGVAQPLLAWPHNSQIVSTTAAPISYGLPAVGGPPPTAAATAMALQAVASNVNLAPTVSYSTLKIDDFIDKYKVLEGLSEHGKEIMRKLLKAIQKQVENPRGLPKWLSHSNNILFLLQMARLIKKAIAQLPEGSDLETIFGRVAASAIRPQSDLQGYSSNPDAVRFDANEPGIIKSLLRDWEKEWNLMKQHQNVPRKKGKPDLVGAFGKRWENVVKAVMDDREALLRGDAGWFTANMTDQQRVEHGDKTSTAMAIKGASEKISQKKREVDEEGVTRAARTVWKREENYRSDPEKAAQRGRKQQIVNQNEDYKESVREGVMRQGQDPETKRRKKEAARRAHANKAFAWTSGTGRLQGVTADGNTYHVDAPKELSAINWLLLKDPRAKMTDDGATVGTIEASKRNPDFFRFVSSYAFLDPLDDGVDDQVGWVPRAEAPSALTESRPRTMRPIPDSVLAALETEPHRDTLMKWIELLRRWELEDGVQYPKGIHELPLQGIAEEVFEYLMSILFKVEAEQVEASHTYTPDLAFIPNNKGAKPLVIEVWSMGKDKTMYDRLRRLAKYNAAFAREDFDFEVWVMGDATKTGQYNGVLKRRLGRKDDLWGYILNNK